MSTSTKSFPHNGKPVNASGAVSIDPSAIEKTPSGAIHFDATTNRRQRMKVQSAAKSNSESVEKGGTGSSANEIQKSQATPAKVETPASSTPPKSSVVANSVPTNATPWWQRVMREFPAEGLASAGVAPASVAGIENLKTQSEPKLEPQIEPVQQAASSQGGHSLTSLRQFLVNFVVEQTGYPEDIVELDADLEADLGIDSIKKAQMFGEIGEYFGLQPDESLSLDDFTTLASVLNYLANQVGTTTVGSSENEQIVAPNTAELANDHRTSTATSESGVVRFQSSSNEPNDATKSSSAELKAFLVNFVVEQTGYPEDIVEMDADLEADLGIDSIKKAQMFGEIGEYFGLEPDENLSLDDFTTLARVLRYLEENVRR